MGVGQPTERELMCLWHIKLWEGLILFAALFEGPEPKKKSAKPAYDWRVSSPTQGEHDASSK